MMQRYDFDLVHPEQDPFSDHAPSARAEAVPSPSGDYVRHCDAQAEIDKLKKTISDDEDDLTAVYMKGRADGKGSASAEIAQLKAERDNAERKFLEESRIVDRVWRALGVSDYASADGKSIDEIVSSLRADLAAARDALDGEHERALTEAAEELNKDPQDMMSGEDIAGYLRFRARAARRAAEAKGGKRPLKISVVEHRDHTEHENNVHAEFARLRKELNDARDERDAARAALAVELEACGFYRQAHESCIDEFQYGTPAPVDRRCDDCIDYDARRSAEAKASRGEEG